MSKSLKILVCGDVVGKFNQLFTRINTVQKKAGNFDMLFCVGDFFGQNNEEWKVYESGNKAVPLPTFILGPCDSLNEYLYKDANGCELCNNVTYLGKKGKYSTSTGLQVAYLSGRDGIGKGHNNLMHFTNDDIDILTLPVTSDTKFKGVDILLTSEWPKGVEKYANEAEGVQSSDVGSIAVAQLALALKPRYHFSAIHGAHYERQPYRNHKVLQESARHVTRFIALAKVGNPDKKKFLYAFNLAPLKTMELEELSKQPEVTTECPYKLDLAVGQRAQSKEESAPQFFYDQAALDRSRQPQGNKRRGGHHDSPRQHKKPAQPSGPCWFCLGSPEVEKHLVISVGEHTYLSLAKGGLTPDHVLILPIGHHQSTVSAPTDVIEEIDKYKKALKKCFKTHNKATVFFERNYKTSHLQIQVVPVAADLAEEVKESFGGCGQCQGLELAEIPKHSDLKQIVPEGAPYFYVELPSGDKLLHRMKKGFPLQFGREVLADQSLLNMPERVDWRNCKATKDEEIDYVAKFRKLFEDFDFNTTD